MSQSSKGSSFTPSQRANLEIRHADQDRTLDAVHQLEAALGSAAPGRETDWLDDVRTALTALREATVEEQHNADRMDSLLSDVARNQPRLRNRVRRLRTQYQQVVDTTTTLRDELAEPLEQPLDYPGIRQRLARLLTELRHQRSRESDLLYEAYYDAFKTDLEVDSVAIPFLGVVDAVSSSGPAFWTAIEEVGSVCSFCLDHVNGVVRIAGEVDIASSPRLAEALDLLDGPLAIDCSQLEFIDASGLGVLARAVVAHGSVALLSASPMVVRLLEITKLDGVIEVDGASTSWT